MALITHKIDLTSPTFPLISELLTRTVMVQRGEPIQRGGLDAPQVLYGHNIVPTPQGYQSIGYKRQVQPTSLSDFTHRHNLREASTGKAAMLGVTRTGRLFVADLAAPTWLELGTGGLGDLRNRVVTSAFCQGITYIYFAKLGAFTYDFVAKTLVPVTLSGLDPTKILGIVSSNGYLLAYGVGNSVAWSSIIQPTDFVPSLTTGAGAGIIEGAQGETVAAVSTQSGIIFLNANNACAGIYQGNSRFPFSFGVVSGCGGLTDPNFTSLSALDSPSVYAYTTSGLQAITPQQAQFVLPEITEYLSGKRLEDFSDTTLTFTRTNPRNALKKRVAWIADRYLIISYGDSALTHALVIDVALSRIGKLKADHVEVFEFALIDQTNVETPKKSIGLLKANGEVSLVNTDVTVGNSNGTIILGKYQYVRERLMQLQAVELENAYSDSFSVYDLPTLAGKTFSAPVAGYNMGLTGLARKYNFSTTAMNHSILVQGRFHLVSGLLSFNISGKM